MSDAKRWKTIGGAAGLVATGLVAGGILAGTMTAGADTGTGTDTAPGTSTDQPVDPAQPQRPDEELLTGDTKASVEEAVLAEYPGATIERTETDSAGVYESHIVTADGAHLIVQVDEDFAVTGTETGDPGGHHRPGGPGGPGAADDDSGTSDDGGSGDTGTTDGTDGA